MIATDRTALLEIVRLKKRFAMSHPLMRKCITEKIYGGAMPRAASLRNGDIC